MIADLRQKYGIRLAKCYLHALNSAIHRIAKLYSQLLISGTSQKKSPYLFETIVVSLCTTTEKQCKRSFFFSAIIKRLVLCKTGLNQVKTSLKS